MTQQEILEFLKSFWAIITEFIAPIGGLGAIIAFLANWWGNIIADKVVLAEKAKYAQDLERLKTQLELSKAMVARYSEQQFNTYNQLWASLYDLKIAGEQLWLQADDSHLKSFASQLRSTYSTVEKGGLFIEDEQYQQLHKLLHIFSNYEIGKKRLIEIRKSSDHVGEQEIQQITQNRQDIEEYMTLIPDIRISFREQLNV